MKDNNCIFCKIANGEIPSRTIYENDLFRVILDNGPATEGHALVLPKDHYANLFEIPADTAAEAMKTAQTVAAMLKEKLHADGLNLVQNNGETAGQTVHHFHMHIIPRYKGDGQNILWKPGHPSDQELDAVLGRIKG
ncbi:MAG: HIT family protein [Lachnospiraceae bacterium]|jgi:histidine triad (HIT) family protein|nr:HIT family protein [Lachnospiraceae bacterium]